MGADMIIDELLEELRRIRRDHGGNLEVKFMPRPKDGVHPISVERLSTLIPSIRPGSSKRIVMIHQLNPRD